MKFDVITVGTATRDIILSSELFKVVHDPAHLETLGFPTGDAQCFALGGKIDIAAPLLSTGGGATNAAVTFARQGFKTAALIKIGKDAPADEIIKELKQEKITSLAMQEKNNNTAYSVVLLAPGGERTILHYRGASEDLTERDLPLQKLNAAWIYIVPGTIPFEVIDKLISYAKSKGSRIAINPSKYYIEMGIKGLRPLLEKSDVVLMNKEEGVYLTGIPYENENGIFEKLDEIVSGVVVMTDGPKGLVVSDGAHRYRAGIFADNGAKDRTGAGDAFGSGFVAGLLHADRKSRVADRARAKSAIRDTRYAPSDIEYAIRLGSANATSKIEHMGAKGGLLTKKEFENSPRWGKLVISV